MTTPSDLPSFSSVPAAPSFPSRLLTLPSHLQTAYPSLHFCPYDISLSSSPLNLLNLLRNALVIDLIDLVSIIIPSLSHSTHLPSIRAWWAHFLQLVFLIADAHTLLLTRLHDVLRHSSRLDLRAKHRVARVQRAVHDRYEFTVQWVLRGAQRALDAELDTAQEKMARVVRFLMDTVDMVADSVQDMMAIVGGVEVSNVEDVLWHAAREQRGVLLWRCVRWMQQHDATEWIAKRTGWRAWIWGNLWKKTDQETRAALVEQLNNVATHVQSV